MTTITIAAVGDLLMKSEIIASAKQTEGGYRFASIFHNVAPYLRKSDLTIGNLETTFSAKRWHEEARKGRDKCNCPNEKRHPRTGNPLLSCPDELAPALKESGFNVLTTANNHCMDGGLSGLKRTLKVLDKHGIKHAGTYQTKEDASRHLIVRIREVNIGILSYTSGTNAIPVPNGPYVSRMHKDKIASDIRELKRKTDFIIVCLHFGREYRTTPTGNQKKWIRFLMNKGANAILGSHPHVLHPVWMAKTKDGEGVERNRVAASSLGNFVSTRLKKNANTTHGMILILTITKDERGVADIARVDRIPTIVRENKTGNKTGYRVDVLSGKNNGEDIGMDMEG